MSGRNAERLRDVGAAIDTLVDVLHQIGLDGSKRACRRQIPGDVLPALGPSDLRASFAFERSRRTLHGCNRVGTFIADFNMQIHDVVHKPSRVFASR